jgi:catechol 2,3-dioxygenase-like lactoylglutathione lyase family enzyme
MLTVSAAEDAEAGGRCARRLPMTASWASARAIYSSSQARAAAEPIDNFSAGAGPSNVVGRVVNERRRIDATTLVMTSEGHMIRNTQEGKPRIDLKLGGANIFIMDVSSNPKAGAGPAHPHQGLDHFGLQVKNIDAVCADLKSKGAVFSREPVTIRPGTRIAFVTGPDGVSIELLERTPIA